MAHQVDFLDFHQHQIESSIPARFELVVKHFGDRIAVKSENHALTYQELNQAANQLAHSILHYLGEGEEPIALIFNHDVSIITAILGVVKTGKAHVTLNPNDPPVRLAQILADVQPRAILTESLHLPLIHQVLQQLNNQSLLIINTDEVDLKLPSSNPNLLIQPSTLLNIFYTSGSTGKPKGVMHEHRFELYRLWCIAQKEQIFSNDRILFTSSCAFAASNSLIYGALLNGAMLYMRNLAKVGLSSLSQWLTAEQITIFRLPILAFRQWLELLTEQEFFSNVRLAKLSGQKYKKDIDNFYKHFSKDCLLVEQLASTETGWITKLIIDGHTTINSSVLPVGYPLEGRELFLLNEKREKVGFNTIGEIAIKSPYLAIGYWQNPELTQQKFQVHPDGTRIFFTGDLGRMRDDGCLEFLERKDYMVKIRGYRIEPAEVEAAISELPSISQVVVIAVDMPKREEKQLVAYIVPSQAHTPEVNKLRSQLMDRLPNYMIPKAFVILAQLPLTINGKLDRQALPTIDWKSLEINTTFALPRDDLEVKILEIWQTVLELEKIGIHDHFLDLGGDSLIAMQIANRIIDQFNVKISLDSLLQSSTVAAMANQIRQYQQQVK